MNQGNFRHLAAKDFLRGGKPCSAVEELYNELAEQRRGEGPLDMYKIRRMRDGSEISSQMVGAEVPVERI
jgi:hypothetical protein